MSEYLDPADRNTTVGSPPVHPNWTDKEIAARNSRLDRFLEEMKRLDEIEPLPLNFEDLCKGRATTPVYAS